jgi:hypothetical protein
MNRLPCFVAVVVLSSCFGAAFAQSDAQSSAQSIETDKASYSILRLGQLDDYFEVTEDKKYLVSNDSTAQAKPPKFECRAVSNTQTVLGKLELPIASNEIRHDWRVHASELLVADGPGWKVYSLPNLELTRSIDKRTLTSDPGRSIEVATYPVTNPPQEIRRIATGWTDGIYVWDKAATRITAFVALPVEVDFNRDKECEWKSLWNDSVDLFGSLRAIADKGYAAHEQWPFAMEHDEQSNGIRLRFFDQLSLQQPIAFAHRFRSSDNNFTFIADQAGFLVTVDQIKNPSRLQPVAFVAAQPEFALPAKNDWKYRLVNSDLECTHFTMTPPISESKGIDFTSLDGHPLKSLAKSLVNLNSNELEIRAAKYLKAVTPEYERVVGVRPGGFPFPLLVVAEHRSLRFKHVVWADIPMEGLVAELFRQTRPESIKDQQQHELDELSKQRSKDQGVQAQLREKAVEKATRAAEIEDADAAQKIRKEFDESYPMIVFGIALVGTVGIICGIFAPKLRLSILIVVWLVIQFDHASAQGVRISEGAEFAEIQNLPVPGIRGVVTDPHSEFACVSMEKKPGVFEIGIVNLQTGKAVKKFAKPKDWIWETAKISDRYAVCFNNAQGYVFQLDDGRLLKTFDSKRPQSVARFLTPELLGLDTQVLQLPNMEPVKFSSNGFHASSLQTAVARQRLPYRQADGHIVFEGFELGDIDIDNAEKWIAKDLSCGLIESPKINVAINLAKDTSKNKKTQLEITAMSRAPLMQIVAQFSGELVPKEREDRQFSGGWIRMHSTGILIVRWKPEAMARVAPIRVRLDTVSVISPMDTEIEIDGHVESEARVTRVGTQSQPPSTSFKGKRDVARIELKDVASMLIRESTLEFPSSIQQLIEAYRTANRSWIEIVERKNQQPLEGLPILSRTKEVIELENSREQAIEIPFVVRILDTEGLESQFGKLLANEVNADNRLTELVKSVNLQFKPIEPTDTLLQLKQPIEIENPKVVITKEVESAKRGKIVKWIGLVMLFPLGLIGIPFALWIGQSLTCPPGTEERAIGWWRLLLIGGCFACLKPILDWTIGLGLGTILPQESGLSILLAIPLSVGLSYALLFGIASITCKAHFGRIANTVLVAIVVLVASEIPRLIRLLF